MEKRYLRRTDVAKELGVSIETVNKFIEDGLKVVILGPRNVYVDRVDLDEYMQAHKS